MSKSSKSASVHEVKVRLSVGFTREQHDALAKLAADHNVSICWIVRHACDLLVDSQDKNMHLHNLKLNNV